MSRSSFSIRRLISPRPSPTTEEYRHSEDSNGSEDLYLSSSRRRQQEAKSWAPTKRLSNTQPERPSIEDVLVRRSQSPKRIPSGVPRLQGSPHSSSSSLCSCECPTDTASAIARDGTLCCSQPQERPSRPSAPKPLAERRHLWISPLSPPYDSVHAPSSTEADVKAREAGFKELSSHPALRETLTPPTTPEEEKYGLDRWSPNVQHLIRETDEAFKAVGTAIEEAKMAVSNFPSPTDAGRTSTSSAPSPYQPDSQNFPLRQLQVRSSTPALSSAFGAPMPLAPKPREKNPKKAQRFKTTSKKSARWHLGEDVAGIISGQFFRKVEVDELLTPDRLDELRMEREAQSQPRRSSDTLRTASTDDSETPLEPFHLQDLPSRIGAAGVKMAVPPADVVVPPSPLNVEERLEHTLRKKLSRRKKAVTKKEYEAEGPSANVEAGAPPPPAKNPARFLARPQAPLLPTIPEVVVTTPGTGATPTNKKAARSFAPVDEDDFVFFQSTDYTLNHPTFQHGPIRFPRTEVVKGMKIDPDDTLDWTAFQMAILGGAGYLFPDSTDFSQPPENEEAADLAAWFDAFGFDSPGILITSDDRARSLEKSHSNTPAKSAPNPSARIPADSELPIPVGTEFPTGFWNEGAVNVSKLPKDGCGIRRWTMEGHLKRYNRKSVESLPPSPMLDLVMMRDSDGEPEVVPMGYNLGHDLEDFLKWEAENVCVLGVY